jgi:hypothetical protein
MIQKQALWVLKNAISDDPSGLIWSTWTGSSPCGPQQPWVGVVCQLPEGQSEPSDKTSDDMYRVVTIDFSELGGVVGD